MSRRRRVLLAVSFFVFSTLLLLPLMSGRARAAGEVVLDRLFDEY